MSSNIRLTQAQGITFLLKRLDQMPDARNGALSTKFVVMRSVSLSIPLSTATRGTTSDSTTIVPQSDDSTKDSSRLRLQLRSYYFQSPETRASRMRSGLLRILSCFLTNVYRQMPLKSKP